MSRPTTPQPPSVVIESKFGSRLDVNNGASKFGSRLDVNNSASRRTSAFGSTLDVGNGISKFGSALDVSSYRDLGIKIDATSTSALIPQV